MKYTQFVKQFRDANPDLKMSHADCMKHPEIKKAFKEITGSGVCVNTRDGNVNIKINDAQKCDTPQTSGPQAGMRRSAAPAPAIVRGGPTLPSPAFDSPAPPQRAPPQQQQQETFLPPDETEAATEVSSVTGYNFGSAYPDYGDAYEHSTKVSGDINPFTPFATPMGYDATSDASSYAMDPVNPFQVQTQEQRQAPLNVLEPGIGYYPPPAFGRTGSIPSSQSSVPSAKQGNVLEQGIPYYPPAPFTAPSSVESPPYGSTQSSFASQSSVAPSNAATSSTVSSYPFDIKMPDALQRRQAAQAAPGAAIGLYSRMEDFYDQAQRQAKNAGQRAAAAVGEQAQKAADAVGGVKKSAGERINESLGKVDELLKKGKEQLLNQAKSNPEGQQSVESIVNTAKQVSPGNMNVNGNDVSAYIGRQAANPNSLWNKFQSAFNIITNAGIEGVKKDPFGAVAKASRAALVANGYSPLDPFNAATLDIFLKQLKVPDAYAKYAANAITGFNSVVPAAAQVALGSILMKAVQAGPQAIGPAINMLQGAIAMVPPAADAIAEYGPYLVGFGIAGPQEGFNDSALAQFEKQWKDKLWQGDFNSPKEWDSEKKKWVNVKAYRSALARMEPLRKKAYRDLMVRLDRERDREAKLLIKSRKK